MQANKQTEQNQNQIYKMRNTRTYKWEIRSTTDDGDGAMKQKRQDLKMKSNQGESENVC